MGATSVTAKHPANPEDTARSKLQHVKYCLSSRQQSLQQHLAEPSFVILCLLLAYVDILLGSLQLSGGSVCGLSSAALNSLRNVILALHSGELLCQMAVFGDSFFLHWGYSSDTVLLATRLLDKYSILATSQHRLHLLSCLRVWRFVHVVQAVVAGETSRHSRTKQELSEWKRKATVFREETEREKRSSKKNRELMKGEVETLREALKIAALDVAAANIGPGIRMNDAAE